jgi:REP element-mobilizing transposase RayT
MVDIVTNRNCVYQTAYHVIWCPKYRRDVLIGAAATEVSAMLDVICAERGWPVISKEIQPDHIHLFLSIPPAIAVAAAVKVLRRHRAPLVPPVPGDQETTMGRPSVVAVLLRGDGRQRQRRNHPAPPRTLEHVTKRR